MKTTVDVTVETPKTAVDVLAEASGLPRQRIKDAMTKGACWWRQKGKQVRLRRAKRELPAGARIQLFYDEKVLQRNPEPAVLLENRSRYSIWFKPHGLLAQGSQWGDHCSLLRVAEIQLSTPCFLVHRLDADAAGLMLIAHDQRAAGALSRCFAEREITKVYRARVAGLVQADNRLLDTTLDGKAARSRISTLSQDEDTLSTLLRVVIETGRKHQIRRHLAAIGHPILGDRLYGQAGKYPLQLVAVELGFECPFARRHVTFRLPEDYL